MRVPLAKALGGGPLRGSRLLRFVFIDESGTGDPDREPYVTLAAVVVHADQQLRKLEDYLTAMAEEFVPKDTRHLFKGFHATELYSGGKVFKRDQNNFGCWRHILDELATIPEKFDMPISWGYVRRADFIPGGKYHDGSIKAGISPIVAAQMAAFATASVGIDHWFNKAADTDEIGQFVLENNEQSKRFIRDAHRVLADPKSRHRVLPDSVNELRQIGRVRWAIYFEEKGESNATQMADFCAWAIARRLAGVPDSARYCDPLLPFLVNKLRDSPDGVLIPESGSPTKMSLS